MYEIKKVSLKSKVFKVFCLVAGSLLIAFLYMWFVTSVLKVDLPKTAFLKAEHARLDARLDLLNSKMDRDQEILDGLRVRDEDVYRSIFGMNEIPAEVRNAGIGGVDRYAYLDGLEKDNYLKNTALRLDRLTRQTTVQSKSFDEIASVSKTAGDMVSCIPAIPPIVPDPSKYHLSSPFGYRSDPFTTESKMHTGVDFAMDIGNPIYATGDGVVEGNSALSSSCSRSSESSRLGTNTAVFVYTADGEMVCEIPAEGGFPSGIFFEGEELFVLYNTGDLFRYDLSDASETGAAKLGIDAGDAINYELLADGDDLCLQPTGGAGWLAIIDRECMELENMIESAIGYFPETGAVLTGTWNRSTRQYIVTAFEHYSADQLREKAEAFIGGNEIRPEMREQYGLSGESLPQR